MQPRTGGNRPRHSALQTVTDGLPGLDLQKKLGPGLSSPVPLPESVPGRQRCTCSFLKDFGGNVLEVGASRRYVTSLWTSYSLCHCNFEPIDSSKNMNLGTSHRTQLRREQLLWKCKNPLLVCTATLHVVAGCSHSVLDRDRHTYNYKVTLQCQFCT